MRTSLALLIISVVLSSPAFGQSSTSSVEVTSAGSPRTLDDSSERKVKFWLQQLIVSALYRNVILDSTAEEWQRLLASPSQVLWRFSSPTMLAIPERRVLEFHEVLLPFAEGRRYPADIFLRHGGKFIRLTKYDPWVLQKLIGEVELPPKESLDGVPRALF